MFLHSLPIYFKNSPSIHLLKDLIPDKDKIFLVILYIQIQCFYSERFIKRKHASQFSFTHSGLWIFKNLCPCRIIILEFYYIYLCIIWTWTHSIVRWITRLPHDKKIVWWNPQTGLIMDLFQLIFVFEFSIEF